jgi:DNA helicase IV
VTRRRHLHTAGRRLVSLDDDVLDAGAVDATRLTGEAALLASLRSGRTGRMSDIVATIQADQDRIIREDPSGILVVEGGPGTGKTVVALHRAAYLLYTYRKRLARRGILVIGPSAAFLRYIDQVLPSLGENDVVLATTATLFPGAEASGRTHRGQPGSRATRGWQASWRVAVIAPPARVAGTAAALGLSPRPDLDAPVAVLTPGEAKGLEFDSVIIVDPAGIEQASPRGRADLYVALTRTTRRLGLVGPGDLRLKM